MAETWVHPSDLSFSKQESYVPKSKFPPGYSYTFFLPGNPDRIAYILYTPIDTKRNVFSLSPDLYSESATHYSEYVKVFGPQHHGIGLAAWTIAEQDFQYNHGYCHTRITVDQSTPFRWASNNLPHIWDSLKNNGYSVNVLWYGLSVGDPAWTWEARI